MTYPLCIDVQVFESPVFHNGGNSHAFISSFFDDDFKLPEVIALLHRWLGAAFSRRSRLEKKDMIQLAYLKEKYCRLIEAAATLSEYASNQEDSLENEVSLLEPRDMIANMKRGLDLWDSFPRYLSRVEIINPYHALRECFDYKAPGEWCRFLEELYEAAGNRRSVAELSAEPDLYYVCCNLFKLLEACHLIKIKRRHGSANGK